MESLAETKLFFNHKLISHGRIIASFTQAPLMLEAVIMETVEFLGTCPSHDVGCI